MKKYFLLSVLLFWLLVIIAAFYIVQKPDFISISNGLASLVLTIFIPVWMVVLASCMGSYFLRESDAIERILLGSAIGMGIFGLAGFGLAISGLANRFVITGLFLGLSLFFIYSGKFKLVWDDLHFFIAAWVTSARSTSQWIPYATGTALGLAFLLGLAPPIEDFDALLYHLTVPEWWLRDAGLFFSTAVGYWVPHIVEGSFVFPLVFGVDAAAHLIHLYWLAACMGLIWHWGRQIHNEKTAWEALAILLTMPSLPWLASWAYNDFALAFTGLAVIYAVWKWSEHYNEWWAIVGGIMAGLAMGAKYQSFFMPVIAVLLLLAWQSGPFFKRLRPAIFFSAATLLFAFPWYLRNWLWTGNPIYPFVFGGPQWDVFLTAIQPGIPGSGIGYDLPQLLMLPLTTTLGIQDANFFDGRIGPFFLILAPITIWSALTHPPKEVAARRALLTIFILGLTGIISWTMGVINISSLFQSRYLFPSLFPLSIPLAISLQRLELLDHPRLKVSFIFRFILALTAIISLFNFGLQTILRNPLSVALGMTTRQNYMEDRQQGYAQALELIGTLPENASVYFLFEPRAYGMPARVTPDSIVAHFEHDLWRLHTVEPVVEEWKTRGFTHVLISSFGAEFKLSEKPEIQAQLQEVKDLLIKVDETPNGEYELYKIP